MSGPTIIEIRTLSRTQEEFVYCPSRFSCFDGGVATFKTASIVLKGHILSCLFPGNRGAFFRYTEEDLKRTVRSTFKQLVSEDFYDKGHGGVDREGYTRYINGSEILWIHLKDISENTIKSLELGWFGISQAEECEAWAYENLEGRLRWRPPGMPEDAYFPQYGFIECNPSGKDWVYYKFHPEERSDCLNYAYFFEPTDKLREFWMGRNPAYFRSLESKPESWKRRYFYGSRDVSEGAWHKEFREDVHCYWPEALPRYGKAAGEYEPFKHRKIRAVYAFFDYGLTSESAVEWVAIDSEGFRWFFHELYGVKTTIAHHAFQILEEERKLDTPIVARYADPSIFFESRRDAESAMLTGNRSVADEYAANGVWFVKADNNQKTGYENLEELLKIDKTRANPVTGQFGSPLAFFSTRCPNLIAQVKNQRKTLKRNPLSGETEYTDERDSRVPDHAYDDAVYCANFKHGAVPSDLTMARPVTRYIHA